MKAAVYREYGKDTLRLEEVAKPVPGDREVLLRVGAVAINDWDWQLLLGSPFINRLANGLRRPRKTILGLDVAGRVEAVGSKATRFKPGDLVYGDISGAWGGFAEFVCAPEASLAPKPACLSIAEAAALSHAGNLAVQGLIDVGRIREGERVLINGAGGGVGTLAMQIAKSYGAEVTGVDKAGKLAWMRSLGFDQVIDYAREDFARNGRRYDLILDTKTCRPISDYLRALSPEGRYATVGGDLGRIFGGVLLLGPLRTALGRKRVRLVALKANKDSAYLNGLCEKGKLKPVIDGPHPWSDVLRQMQRFGAGECRGRIVIEVGALS